MSRLLTNLYGSPVDRKAGYVWQEAGDGMALVPVDGAKFADFQPEPAFFRDLAFLDPTAAAVLKFANRYGVLCAGPQGSFLESWQHTISELRRLVDIADSLSNVNWTALQKLLGIKSDDPQVIADAAVSRLAKMLKKEGIDLLTIQGAWNPVFARVEIRFQHADLRAFAFFQLCLALFSGRQFHRCEGCGRWFEIGRQAGRGFRTDKMVCSDSCRFMMYRKSQTPGGRIAQGGQNGQADCRGTWVRREQSQAVGFQLGAFTMARKQRGRNEGGISQRADGLWVARLSLGYGPDGKRLRKAVYGRTKTEVMDELKKLSMKGARAVKDSVRWTLAKYLQHWLAIVKPTVQPGTYRPYASHVELHIAPILGNVRLCDLDQNHIESWYAELAAKGMSAAMQRKVGTTLTIALEKQVGRTLGYNPAKKVAKPMAVKFDKAPLDPAQVASFLQAAEPDKYFALYLLLLDSGMRPGEALALEWADIDLVGGFVTIDKSLEEIAGKHRIKVPKTKKSNRRIRISNATVAAMAEHRRKALANGFIGSAVFHNTIGGWIRLHELYVYSFKPILKKAGLGHVRLYDLRHRAATLLLLAEVNPKIVSERLGHSTIALTLDTYSHVLPTMQERSAEIMNTLLSQRPAAVNE